MGTILRLALPLGALALAGFGALAAAGRRPRALAIRRDTEPATEAVNAPEPATADKGREASPRRDTARQAVVALLALLQVASIGLAFGGQSFDEKVGDGAPDPLVTPANYAFVIWGPIFGGCLAYAAYQALPALRRDPLLRRIGWWTAAAFAATAVWLFAAANRQFWLTVVCIFAMLATLAGALAGVRAHGALGRAQCWLVAAPLGLFAGWTTVATVANTSSFLTGLGFWSGGGPADQAWASGMLLVAGAIAAAMVRYTRRNPAYAGAVVWALAGIAANAVAKGPLVPVIAASGAAAALVAGALLRR